MTLPTDRFLANKRFDFHSAALDPGTFAVVQMEGFEAISQPFRFTLTLVAHDAALDPEPVLAQPATFTIHAPDGAQSTPYHGVLAEFDQLHRADGYVFYRATLVPRVWNLSLYRASEVYLNEQTIPSVLMKVMNDAQFRPDDFEFRLTATYRPRSFVCQYEETHLDFLSRWMEHEGIYYYFDHGSGTDRLIAVDNVIMHDAAAVPLDYRPDDELDTGVSGRAVRDFVVRHRPLPREVVLQDYNHRKAALELNASAIVSQNGRGQMMLYGENFRDLDEGNRYAKLRAEEMLCNGRTFSGEGRAVGMRSGYFAELSHHYRTDLNGRYLITEIHHEGSQAGALLAGMRAADGASGASGEIAYRNRFRAIGAAVQFRAPRRTPKPRIAGTMNATVDSEGSDRYADLDEYGQYKVQLPFDLTAKHPGKGSARIRMATPYSGSDHGMHFPLHKGAEVLLSFVDGDPDQPVILGAVPNSTNRSVVSERNAHANLIHTAGGNEIRLNDQDGSQVTWLSSPYMNSVIGVGATSTSGPFGVDIKAAGHEGILLKSDGAMVHDVASDHTTIARANQSSVVIGTNNQVVAGARGLIVAGVNANYTAGGLFNGNLGSSIAFNAGMEVAVRTAATYSVNFTKNFEWGLGDRKIAAAKKVTISGGDVGVGATLNTVGGVLAAALGTTVVAQSAVAAAAAATVPPDGETAGGLQIAEYTLGAAATAGTITGGLIKTIHAMIAAPAVGTNGILELDSASATLKGPAVTVDASVSAEIKAPDVTVDASASATVKAPAVTVDASTSAEIKAPDVTLKSTTGNVTVECNTGAVTVKSTASSITVDNQITIKSTSFAAKSDGNMSLDSTGILKLG